MDTSHTERNDEVRMSEVEFPVKIPKRFAANRRQVRHFGSGRWFQTFRTLNFPSLSTVQTSSQHMLSGFGIVDVVAGWIVFEKSNLKANNNLISPGPDAMVGWPSTEFSILVKDGSVFNDPGFLRQHADGGKGKDSDSSDLSHVIE